MAQFKIQKDHFRGGANLTDGALSQVLNTLYSYTQGAIAIRTERFVPGVGQTQFALQDTPSGFVSVYVNGQFVGTEDYEIIGNNLNWLGTNYNLEPSDILVVLYTVGE